MIDHQEKASETAIEDEGEDGVRSVKPLSYFGTDFDVHGLVRRLNEGDIVVPSFDPPPDEVAEVAGFQRGFVWKKPQMERFIESLLLGFPVPGIFLVQQLDKKLLVLDGQQRLRTLQAFYSNEIVLENVVDELKGITYELLDTEARRTLDNTFIHATVVKFDAESGGGESVYQLFERLNTGGTNLYPHEIRVALYSGELVELLQSLNHNADWRVLYGNPSPRLKDHELILRFLAFLYWAHEYSRPLKSFLNEFTRKHRHLEGLDKDEIVVVFEKTCLALREGVGKRAFRLRTAVNAALVDAVMVGVATRVKNGGISSSKNLDAAFASLLENEDFLAAIGRATADEERVSTRLTCAIEAFRRV